MQSQGPFIKPADNSDMKESPALTTTNTIHKTPARRSRRRIVYGVIVLIILVPIAFLLIARATQPDFGPVQVSPNELQTVTHIPATVFAQINTGGLSNPLISTRRNSGLPAIAVGKTGKPLFFSDSAEFCPFCAGERWAIVVALSQFGTFSKIERILSSEDSIATFTFQDVVYSSAYLDLLTFEGPQETSRPVPTRDAQEQQILSHYNAAPYVTGDFQGKVPFLDIGNRYLISGAAFDTQTLIDYSWQDIAGQLSDPHSSVAQHIIGAANYIIAAVCTVTQEHPSSLCQRSEIMHIQQRLSA